MGALYLNVFVPRWRRCGGQGFSPAPMQCQMLFAAAHESVVGTNRRLTSGRACPLCPGISDINLFRYCQGVINLDAEISDRAFDLGMPEQELDSPQIARSTIDQGSFCASQ